jgi:hypothetical protein
METNLAGEIIGIEDAGENSYVFYPVNEAVELLAESYEISLEELKKISENLALYEGLGASKDEFQNGFLTMWNADKFSFDPETFEIDGLEVLDSYEDNSNTYITIGGFPLSEQQDEKIKKEIRQRILNAEGLNRLHRDVLEKIFVISSPKDILSLCQTNEKFAETCRNPEVFIRLLDRFYPNTVYTEDPRKQFIAIAEGLKTFYRMEVDGDSEVVIMSEGDGVSKFNFLGLELLHKPSRIEDIEGWSVENMSEVSRRNWEKGKRDDFYLLSGLPEEYEPGLDLYKSDNDDEAKFLNFYVDGLEIPKGETLFILMDTGMEAAFQVQVFKTREQIADYYVTFYDSYLGSLLELFFDSVETDLYELYGDEFPHYDNDAQLAIIEKNGYTAKYNTFLEKLGVRIPFTKESMREQALHDENLYLYPDTYHHQYQVIEAKF